MNARHDLEAVEEAIATKAGGLYVERTSAGTPYLYAAWDPYSGREATVAEAKFWRLFVEAEARCAVLHAAIVAARPAVAVLCRDTEYDTDLERHVLKWPDMQARREVIDAALEAGVYPSPERVSAEVAEDVV